ncbi:MAG: hypothetical protein KAS04_06065 [Candidatus Aenigmarchaeota archaeon]|nr:hypothetical protein [Candidatus Aenigmarchaeota archaeon]
MAEIESIDIEKKDIILNLKISKDEYKLIRNNTSNLLVVPKNKDFLNGTLTTGRLGNSNRIMLPKKILKLFDVSNLEKKVPAKTFNVGDEVFILIKLKQSTFGIPTFKEV